MNQCILLSYISVVVCVGASGMYDGCESSEECGGDGYSCVGGQCRCSRGYILHPEEDACIRCPRLGNQCYGYCCSSRTENLQCWQGTCQPCQEHHGAWICGDQLNGLTLTSATQIAMAAALVLGILATFVLLYKLCAASDINSFGTQSYRGGRLSVGSMQVYVDERLRDAPPRYSRASPAGIPPVFPSHGNLNAGFIHDSSVPPPLYSEPLKDEEPAHPALHI